MGESRSEVVVDIIDQNQAGGANSDSVGSSSSSTSGGAVTFAVPVPTPPPLPKSVQNPVNNTGTAEQVCKLFMSGECPHGISGRTNGSCPDKHPKRCMPYMRWGSKHERGCSGTTCGKLHPTVCPKSLNLKCFDRLCPWKLHTQRCLRATQPGSHPHDQAGGWARVTGRRQTVYQHRGPGYSDRPGQARPSQVRPNHGRPAQSRPFPAGPHIQPGGNHGQTAVTAQSAVPTLTQGFLGVTAQQNLLGTLEQQLQQAVTRVVLQALTGAIPGLGIGTGSVPPSS